MEDGRPESFMDLDEFFAFRNALCANAESDVYVGVADFDEPGEVTPSTPNPESLVGSVWDDISGDQTILPYDNESDEGNGGSVTSETPSNSVNTSRESSDGANERKSKRRRSKKDKSCSSTTSQTATGQEEDRAKNSVRSDRKDEKYWMRRKKNNLAAKKSRDQKRKMELYTAERANKLEKENAELRSEIARLKAHLNDLNEVVEEQEIRKTDELKY